MDLLKQKARSPYAAGIVIGLLQIPALLLIETALGASSSYVTVGGLAASIVDPSILDIDYVARHVAATLPLIAETLRYTHRVHARISSGLPVRGLRPATDAFDYSAMVWRGTAS